MHKQNANRSKLSFLIKLLLIAGKPKNIGENNKYFGNINLQYL